MLGTWNETRGLRGPVVCLLAVTLASVLGIAASHPDFPAHPSVEVWGCNIDRWTEFSLCAGGRALRPLRFLGGGGARLNGSELAPANFLPCFFVRPLTALLPVALAHNVAFLIAWWSSSALAGQVVGLQTRSVVAAVATSFVLASSDVIYTTASTRSLDYGLHFWFPCLWWALLAFSRRPGPAPILGMLVIVSGIVFTNLNWALLVSVGAVVILPCLFILGRARKRSATWLAVLVVAGLIATICVVAGLSASYPPMGSVPTPDLTLLDEVSPAHVAPLLLLAAVGLHPRGGQDRRVVILLCTTTIAILGMPGVIRFLFETKSAWIGLTPFAHTVRLYAWSCPIWITASLAAGIGFAALLTLARNRLGSLLGVASVLFAAGWFWFEKPRMTIPINVPGLSRELVDSLCRSSRLTVLTTATGREAWNVFWVSGHAKPNDVGTYLGLLGIAGTYPAASGISANAPSFDTPCTQVLLDTRGIATPHPDLVTRMAVAGFMAQESAPWILFGKDCPTTAE